MQMFEKKKIFNNKLLKIFDDVLQLWVILLITE